jgi:regulator of protease activity HflC (stomatin/prohibitin superfamily)
MFAEAVGIAVAIIGLLVVLTAMRTIRIVPQARARNVERFGRYTKTMEPGMNFIIPFIDRVKPLIDLREQVVSFLGQPVITEDNLVVKIDTVLFFQVTDPRAADYEIVNYIQAIEQLTATMLRSVIGSMDLEVTLTSRDKINTMLRGVLDDASGKWGIRVTRVEIKAIDPPKSVIDAMEKQMRAEREKRAAILTAEGLRQAQILTADGDKQGTVLRAEGDKQSAILRAEGQAQAITSVFQSIHENDPDPKLLAYQYLQTLPQIAQGPGNTMWMIPSELTSALKALSSAFDSGGAAPDAQSSAPSVHAAGRPGGSDAARPAGAEASAADAVLAKVVQNAAALARNTSADDAPPQAALEAAVAAVPQAPPPPDVPLPEALLATAAVPEARLPEVAVTDPAVLESLDGLKPADVAEVQEEPGAANGAAAGAP